MSQAEEALSIKGHVRQTMHVQQAGQKEVNAKHSLVARFPPQGI